MNWERVALAVMTIGLIASLSTRASSVRTSSVPPPPAANGTPSAGSIAPTASAAGEADATCMRELDACHGQAWAAVAAAIQDDVRQRRRGAGEGDAGAGRHGSSAEAQQRELDDIAREQLRKSWKDKQADILKSVRDVGTEGWIPSEIDKSVAHLEGLGGVDAAATRALRDGYGAIWARDGAAMHDAVTSSPPDMSELLADVKTFYADEDAMVADVLGPAGLARYREDQRRSRTAILAIVAALADEDWDDAIAW